MTTTTWLYRFKRWWKFLYQKLTRGFSDEETWNLDARLAEHILPRLRRFKEVNRCSPMSMSFEEWNVALDQMIFAFEWLATDIVDREEGVEVWNKVQAGTELFGKHYASLWW